MSAASAAVGPAAPRAAVLRRHGASDAVVAELLAYGTDDRGAGSLGEAAARPLPALPLEDEPSVAAWEEYAAEAAREGVLPALRRRLVQLRFPIAAGMADDSAYQAATRRGIVSDAARDGPGLALERPDALRLTIHQTPAGRVPVVVAAARGDFVALVRALTRRNEPSPVPDSMGACIVGGYNNWDRVRRLREVWEAERAAAGADASDAAWGVAFREIVPQRARYQDRFILLGSGPYSAVPARAMGMSEPAWLAASAVIRREHECAHYFTRRVLGSMRNTLLDELIADYAGIVAAAGRYRADWFLRFVGLEAPGAYRTGARLENYRGTPPLSDAACVVLQSVVRAAAANLEAFDAGARASGRAPALPVVITAVAFLGLELLAADDGAVRLGAAVADVAERSAA